MSSASLRAGRLACTFLLLCVGAGAHAQEPFALDALASDVRAAMTPAQEGFYERLAGQDPADLAGLSVCWSETADPRVRGVVDALLERAVLGRYYLFPRWQETATDGPVPAIGTPITLTWSIVPDGTIVPTFFEGSDLIATFDATQADWRDRIQQGLDAWTAVSGVRYVYEPNDDGAQMTPLYPGVLGVRGDVRIGGIAIDGPSGTLAFNYSPDWGDMVLDTTEVQWADATDDYLWLRNTVAHEAGHGIGMKHVESSTDGFLMEPFIQVGFDGPQLDDILGSNLYYGDQDEFPSRNDDIAGATVLALPDSTGLVAWWGRSIDDAGESDVFAFDVPAGNPPLLSVVLQPTGDVYFQGPQGEPQFEFDSRVQQDLQIELLAADGIEVLHRSSVSSVSSPEILWPGPLRDGPGTYYLRVSSRGGSDVQRYDLELRFDLRAARLDCDGNGVDDRDQIAASAALDCNDNGYLDSCEIQPLSEAVGEVDLLGFSWDVVGDGSLVYVPGGDGDRLDIVDVSDPAAPSVLSSTPTFFTSVDVARVDQYLYVLGRFDGLGVFDVTDPRAPSNLNLVPDPFEGRDMVARGDHLFVATEADGLAVVDIQDRGNPTTVAFGSVNGSAQGVLLDGDFAYVAAGFGGVSIFDVSTPSAPVFVTDYATFDDALGVVLGPPGTVLALTTQGAEFIDVVVPAVPFLVGRVDGLFDVRDARVDGDLLYTVSEEDLTVFDLFDGLFFPAVLTQVPTPGPGRGLEFVDGSVVVAAGLGGLSVYSPVALDVDGDDVIDGCTVVVSAPEVVGSTRRFALHGGVPNPFNPRTEIRFETARESAVELVVYDVAGRRVRTLVDGTWSAGVHAVPWDGTDETGARVASGVYFVRLTAGEFSARARVSLLK